MVLCLKSFNSRTPGGVRPSGSTSHTNACIVSIHAPREGCDESFSEILIPHSCFNSRTPGGVRQPFTLWEVSIERRFNSRTPGGVRPTPRCSVTALVLFQFTHPGRGATAVPLRSRQKRKFQFTHPGRGATRFTSLRFYRSLFQFTHPGRGATRSLLYLRTTDLVSIHAPREGCDSVVQSCVLWGG